MIIREAKTIDFEKIWSFFSDIVKSGETYTYEQNISKDEAIKIWMDTPIKTFVVIENDEILGSYFIKTNQNGNGKHVCNCGYMVSSLCRGKGIATILCKHSQEQALKLGYKAMQFNFVVSTNTIAVQLWEKLGFNIVGTLPKAFNHPTKGYVDSFVMYKWLDN